MVQDPGAQGRVDVTAAVVMSPRTQLSILGSTFVA